MVDVDINVKHSLVVLEQLQDGQDDVVDVTEATGLALLGVVEPSGPIDRDVSSLEKETYEIFLRIGHRMA